MLGLGNVVTDFVDGAGNSRGVLHFAGVDGLGLDAVVNFAPCNVVGSSAQSGDGLNVGSSAGSTADNALQVSGGLELGIAHEGTGAVVVVVGQGADALLDQALVPALEGLGFHDLQAFLVVVHDVSHVQDADVIDIAGQTAGVGQNSDAHALQSLVDHVFLSAQLAGGVDGNLDLTVGLFSNAVSSSLQTGVDHGLFGLGGGDLQLVNLVGVSLAALAAAGSHAQNHDQCQHQCQYFFHTCVSS